MRILGIDPGVAIVGFGVLDCAGATQRMVQYGAISTPAGMPLAARLALIESDLAELIGHFHPDEMAIEELFFSKNITTGIAVAHARGVILCTAEKLHLPVYEYTPIRLYGIPQTHLRRQTLFYTILFRTKKADRCRHSKHKPNLSAHRYSCLM